MKKLLNLLLAATLALSITACGTKVATKPETTPPMEGSDSRYPITITNYNYAKEPIEITFEKAPERVLAVYQNSIETLLALGLEDHILAASGLDHEVKPEWKAFSKVNYLTEFAPDKETVVMMQPDFILSWNSLFGEKKLGEVDYWHNNGIKTYIATNTAAPDRTLENEYADILNIGKIFNVEDKAEALVFNEIKAEVKRVQEHTANAARKKKVLIIEFLGDKISNYDAKSLIRFPSRNLPRKWQ